LATVTPSFVIVGEPKDFSRTTFRPLGPSVTLTASARVLTPLSIRSLAEDPKAIIFAGIFLFLHFRIELFQDAQDVVFFHEDMLDAVDFYIRTGIFREQDPVADLDLRRHALAVLPDLAGPTAITLPSCGFSLAVSGMMMPPAVFCSSSTLRTSTLSFIGLIFISPKSS
jgi:hypothetical protein